MLSGLFLQRSSSIFGSTLMFTNPADAFPVLSQCCIFIVERMAPKAVCSCPLVIFQNRHSLQVVWIDTERSLAEMTQD